MAAGDFSGAHSQILLGSPRQPSETVLKLHKPWIAIPRIDNAFSELERPTTPRSKALTPQTRPPLQMRMPLAGRGVAALAALLLLAAAAQAQVMAPGAMAPAMAPATPQPLPPFSAIVLCVPFNVLIAPGDYSLTVDAEPAVASAIQGNVTRGVLALQTASFSTNQPINVTINLPADRLGSLAHYGVLSSVWVNPGEWAGA